MLRLKHIGSPFFVPYMNKSGGNRPVEAHSLQAVASEVLTTRYYEVRCLEIGQGGRFKSPIEPEPNPQ